ncbi:MAG: hypothetical protein IPL53_24935 [Ignavibacteria bacterium]|nr:hypothetical protein [Ignavibacteria bacterium]
MNNNKKISIILFGLFLTTISCGKKPDPVYDYLNTGKEIMFNNVKYNLAWSSNPSDNYYKQEYLSGYDTPGNFKKMILLEVITGKKQLKDAVDSKVAELKKLKESDPVVNYELFEKNGEIMLDFILSQYNPDQNGSDIIERNVYRYKNFTGAIGEEGVLLFGVSERAYGDDIDNFLIALKGKRFDVPNAVGAFVIPEITIKNNK